MSQTASRVQIGIKAQVDKDTPASGAGAYGIDVYATGGIAPTKTPIPSEAITRNGMAKRSRHGSRGVQVVYPTALQRDAGFHEDMLAAMLRASWTPAFAIDESDFTSITTTTSAIVLTSGDAIALGIRAGQMIKLTGHATAGNNGIWLPVVSVTTSQINLPPLALTLNAVADTAVTISVAQHVFNPASVLVDAYHTIEEYGMENDQSEVAFAAVLTKVEFEALPNKIIKITYTWIGLDFEYVDTGTAPGFTSPTYSTAEELVMADGGILVNGVYQDVLTGMKWTVDLQGDAPATLSNVSDDVYLGNAILSGDFSGHREDLTFLNAFDAETKMSIFVHCKENENEPADFLAFWIGNVTLNNPTKGLAASGPMVDNLPWSAGPDTGTDRIPALMVISTSTP